MQTDNLYHPPLHTCLAFGSSGVRAIVIGLFAVSTLLMGCSKPERPSPAGPGVTATALDKTVAELPKTATSSTDSLLTEAQRAIVVAEIEGKTLTLGQLEARLSTEPSVVRSQYATIPKRKEYLANWVQLEVIANEAARLGLDKHPAVVAAMRKQMVRRYIKEKVFDAVSLKDVSDADIKAYYDSNLFLYRKPAQVELRHILLPDATSAQKVLAELKAGADGSAAKLNKLWQDYVRRLSKDRDSVRQLGSLGLVSKEPVPGLPPRAQARLEAIPRALIDAAMKLEPFELGPVVQTPLGYHVIMITSRSPALDRKLEDVQDTIRRRVLQRKRDLLRNKLLTTLRDKANVVIHEDAVRLLPSPGARHKQQTMKNRKGLTKKAPAAGASGAGLKVGSPSQPAPTGVQGE